MPGEENLPIDDVRDLVTPADNAEPVETRQREADPEPVAAKEEPKAPREGGMFDDKRQAVAEKLKAARQAADASPKIDIPDDMERRTVGPNVATRADRTREPEDPQTAANVAAEDIPAPVRRKLKVNGREVELDDAQIIQQAQIALASQDILNEAKQAKAQAQQELAEVQRLRADHSPVAQQQPVPAKAQAEDTKPATDAELDEIINAIQLGDQKEAALALSKHGDIIERRLMDKIGNIDERIAATTQRLNDNARILSETQGVLDSFVSENPDFSQSKRRIEVLFESSVDVMRDNLYAIGIKPEKLEGFAQMHGLAPQAAVSVAYRKLRAEGHVLPDAAKVLVEAAKKVRDDFGMPAPQREHPAPVPVKQDNTEFVAQRIERKQAMAPQPRRANITPGAESAQSEQNIDQKRVEAVRQMRAYRRGR